MSRLLIVSLLAGCAGALIASIKGRSVVGWFFLSFLLPLSLVVLAVLPRKMRPQGFKRCPFCADMMREGDTVCPTCRKGVPVSIEMVTCPSCGVVVQAQSSCSECGAPLGRR